MRAFAGAFVAVAAAPLAMVACRGGVNAPPATVAASARASAPLASAAALPAPTASASVATAAESPNLEWLTLLEPRAVRATKDEFVWATVPTDRGVRVGVYRVLAVDGEAASLQDMLRVRWDKVPGSLVVPAAWAEMATLKKDEIVTYADWRGYVGIAVVVAPMPRLRVTYRDASAVVREEIANVAQRLPDDVRPLAWVMYPRAPSGALAKGLVFAVAGDRALVRDDADQVVVVPRAQLKVVPLPKKPLKPGDNVLAYTSEAGYRPGIVEKEILPRLAYAVAVEGDASSYFFSDLALR